MLCPQEVQNIGDAAGTVEGKQAQPAALLATDSVLLQLAPEHSFVPAGQALPHEYNRQSTLLCQRFAHVWSFCKDIRLWRQQIMPSRIYRGVRRHASSANRPECISEDILVAHLCAKHGNSSIAATISQSVHF